MKRHEFMKDLDENGNEIISVSDKPKRRLDLIPRLICVLVAFVIWIWMVNLNDTDLTEKLTFDIELVGVTLNDDNMMIVENGENDIIIYGISKNKVSVTVQGSNRDIRRFEDENGTIKIDVADLDLSKIDENGTYIEPFEFKMPEESGIKLIESEPLEVSFYADKFVENVPVSFSVLASGEIGNTGISYSFTHELEGVEDGTIMLSGPAKIINQIHSVEAYYNRNFVNTKDALEKTKLDELDVKFFGKGTNEIITMGAVSYPKDSISVSVQATATKELTVTPVFENGNKIPLTLIGDIDEIIEISGLPTVINGIVETEYLITVTEEQVSAGEPIHFDLDDLVPLKPGVEFTKPIRGITISFVPDTSEN